MLAVAWFARSPDWEPAITTLGIVSFFLVSELKDIKNIRTSDKTLLLELINDLPSKGGIDYLRQVDPVGFPSAFNKEQIRDVANFVAKWGNAEHEFINRTMERQRRKLYSTLRELLDYLDMFDTWGEKIIKTDTQKYTEIFKKITKMRRDSYTLHQQLIRTGKKVIDL